MSELLELHRASAGSGKTYTLAKKYLWYYLTVKEENGPRRLRTLPELNDSLNHILAITFTNKATNEMQQRIVEKLDALAFPAAGKSPDYMDDFCRDLRVAPAELSRVCRRALYILLENYSEFQVSTIDSFFQLVLRTFAYETDLNDSYTIELDSDYLARVGIDATLNDIEEKKASASVMHWINILMDRGRESGEKWNIFQKKDDGKSIYYRFMKSVGKLENEDFKQIRDSLEEYFDRTPDLPELYDALDEKYNAPLHAPFERMRAAASQLESVMLSAGSDPTKDKFRDHARKSLRCKWNKQPKTTDVSFSPLKDESFEGNTYLKRKKADPEFYGEAEPLYREMIAARLEWLGEFDSPAYKHWNLYKKNFPYLGLLSVTLRKRREYLEDNNSVELAETNSLLSRIIGEDDAPFIYERLGTRLNHFLIDEFQDTSRMQWNNLRPLLSESLSRGNENLLIGDAKQSIYRFRNADPSLIAEKVESEFGNVRTLGDAPGENTNWRSDPNIVEFNNGFFASLSERLTAESENESGENAGLDYRSLYGNVRQKVRPRKEGEPEAPGGYVEINIVAADKKEVAKEQIVAQMPGIVMELLSRGYHLGDIAFLVDTNAEGEALINEFTRFNSESEEGTPKIEFISEQSLKVASSPSVKLILTTLETIGRGTNPEVRTGGDADKRGVVDWDDVQCNFRVFALRNPGLSTPEQLEKFIASGSDTDAIAEMLAEMQAVTLPALVEGITATFLPSDMRRRDAPFIAAFQDIVLEYCESRPSDIASFLQWWGRRGSKASISSPEGMDAVNVMTVHKAKGLEFPCVVIPFAQFSFLTPPKGKTEWRWVKPAVIELGERELPPFVPVDTSSEMEGTAHEPVYREYIDMVTMDSLNKLYVGFTRAVNELYIFCTEGKRQEHLSTSALLRDFMGVDAAESQITIGEKYAVSPVKRKTETNPAMAIEDYTARVTPDFLKYREENLPTVIDAEEFEEEDPDPRSEGNIMHSVMERVWSREDLHASVTRLRRRGLFSKEKAQEIEEFLASRMTEPEVRGWFDGTAKAINERSIIGGGRSPRRPDRVMLMPDGSAVVIDYKFGSLTSLKKYSRQVRDYVERLKRTGKFTSVEGYLWYVRENRLEKV